MDGQTETDGQADKQTGRQGGGRERGAPRGKQQLCSLLYGNRGLYKRADGEFECTFIVARITVLQTDRPRTRAEKRRRKKNGKINRGKKRKNIKEKKNNEGKR